MWLPSLAAVNELARESGLRLLVRGVRLGVGGPEKGRAEPPATGAGASRSDLDECEAQKISPQALQKRTGEEEAGSAKLECAEWSADLPGSVRDGSDGPGWGERRGRAVGEGLGLTGNDAVARVTQS